jgi:type IV pilus assembly protein PilB
MTTIKGEGRLGELLVREGLITDAQLADALREQQGRSTYVPLGHILVEQKLVTRRQLNLLLESAEKRPRLGELLVRSASITAAQLAHALERQRSMHLPLGQVLIRLGYVSDETMRLALALQLNIPFVDLDQMNIDRALTRLINRSYARRHSLVPVACVGQTLTVCMDDPTDQQAVEELSRSTGLLVTVLTSSHDAITHAFLRMYGDTQQEGATAEQHLELAAEDESDSATGSRYVEDMREVKKADGLVRQLLAVALSRRATDIHLETLAAALHVRFRIDGVLQELAMGQLQDSCNARVREIVSRLKVLGKLDIAERRRPQDGSFRMKVDRGGEQTSVDFRISVVPGYYGESVVLRVLDRKSVPKSLEELGFSPLITDKLREMLKRPAGILLITGPTGSGKSSTLYASLMTLYKPQIRIVTAEDPIEYVYEQFSQSEVNERIGNTFASYLRAFLRHDPEVIMVGEVRDEETAEMAFRAAQTGHLLLTTLHTNDALSAVIRLRDLKVDPNLIASSLLGVLAQRLVRAVCPQCKTEYAPSAELLKEFFDTTPPDLKWYKGKGCAHCNFTGYRGRLAIAELWVPNENDVILIAKNASFEDLRVSAARSTIFMAEDAANRLRGGATNLEELIRMLPYSSIYRFRQIARQPPAPLA